MMIYEMRRQVDIAYFFPLNFSISEERITKNRNAVNHAWNDTMLLDTRLYLVK